MLRHIGLVLRLQIDTLGQTYKCAVLLIPISPELSKHEFSQPARLSINLLAKYTSITLW